MATFQPDLALNRARFARKIDMANPTLLFIDDDPLFLDLLRLFAEEAYPAAHIVCLEHATDVAALCARQTFDCVVLDHNLPGVSGFDTARSLRQAFRYLPIILVTGVGDEMLAASVLKGGVNDYIPKARLSAGVLRRVCEQVMQAMSQRMIIDRQREDLETFAFALAHDIKQPLRQISIFSDLLMAQIEPEPTGEAAMFLRFIQSASGRLAELVDTMLDYAVLSQTVSCTDVHIGSVAEEVCTSLSNYIAQRNGRVEIAADCSLFANKALLAQILQNLVINGLKYNQSPVPTVSIQIAAGNGHCDIMVRDNGIGIEEQYLTDIFKPLRRLHNKDEFSGTGLGLAIVRKAVLTQNGSISCRSEPGSGTQFIVTLPQAKGSGCHVAENRCPSETQLLN